MATSRRMSADKKHIYESFKAFYDICLKKGLARTDMDLRMADLNRLIAGKHGISSRDEYTAWKNISDTINACIDHVIERAVNFPAYQEVIADPAFSQLKKAKDNILSILRELYPAYLTALINQIFTASKDKSEHAIILRTTIISVIQNNNESWTQKNMAIVKLIRDYSHHYESNITSIFKQTTLGSALKENMLRENSTIQFFYTSTTTNEPEIKPTGKSSINP